MIESLPRLQSGSPNRLEGRFIIELGRGRNVQSLFVLSSEDAENNEYADEFGRVGDAFLEFSNAQVNIVPQMDHGLMKARERRLAEDLMAKFARRA